MPSENIPAPNTDENPYAEYQQNDFSMVTFTLGGRDYAIDIMHTSSIIKSDKFTFVPNVAYYVRGVINLRGDIISVIDLRLFFNIERKQADESGDATENIVLLNLNGMFIGVIVDDINHVISVSSRNIQRSLPLFSDINVRYIDGVIEQDEKMYIILDVDRIININNEEEAQHAQYAVKQSIDNVEYATAPPPAPEPAKEPEPPAANEALDMRFIRETLVSLLDFHISPLNERWIRRRLGEWQQECNRNNRDFQLQDITDANNFLRSFFSRSNGEFWSNDLIADIKSLLPQTAAGNYQVWNPGCGNGLETYSLACLFKSVLPDLHLRIRAGDNDLVRITNANQLSITGSVPDFYAPFLNDNGKSGLQFDQKFKDIIIFEFQDVNNTAPYNGLDMVFCRDMVSFLKPEQQTAFLQSVHESLKNDGILVLGDNEIAPPDNWQPIGGFSAYRKR